MTEVEIFNKATDISNCIFGDAGTKSKARRVIMRLVLDSIKEAKCDSNLEREIEQLIINEA